MPIVKLEAKELRKKSIKNLEKTKIELEKRIMKTRKKEKVLDKGTSIKEDKRNIARINTIIQERNKENVTR